MAEEEKSKIPGKDEGISIPPAPAPPEFSDLKAPPPPGASSAPPSPVPPPMPEPPTQSPPLPFELKKKEDTLPPAPGTGSDILNDLGLPVSSPPSPAPPPQGPPSPQQAPKQEPAPQQKQPVQPSQKQKSEQLQQAADIKEAIKATQPQELMKALSSSPDISISPPLFIKVDKYTEIVKNLQKLKSFSLNLRDALDALSEIERELVSGISLAHKALDEFNQVIAGLDAKFMRAHSIEEPAINTNEMDKYIEGVYKQMEKIKKELQAIKEK